MKELGTLQRKKSRVARWSDTSFGCNSDVIDYIRICTKPSAERQYNSQDRITRRNSAQGKLLELCLLLPDIVNDFHGQYVVHPLGPQLTAVSRSEALD